MTAVLSTEYYKGEHHGLVNILANSVPFNDFKHMTPENKAKCEKQMKEDNKLVKGRYKNYRGKHERLTKPYMRWAGDPLKIYHLIPEQVYELPKGFIDEVNDPKKRLAKRSQILDAKGIPTEVDGEPEQLHEIIPVGF